MFEDRLVDVYPSLLSYARRIAGNGTDAEDLVHDAIERGLLRKHQFHDGRLDRWITTILRHLFLDTCRRRQSWRGISVELALLQDTEVDAAEFDGIGGSPPNMTSHGYGPDDVRQALKSLTPPLREVFSLFVFERLPQREIGRRLSLPTSTVGTRLLRARRQLRVLMETEGPRPREASLLRQATHAFSAQAGPDVERVKPAAVSRRANPGDCSWSSGGRTKKIAPTSCSPP